LDPAIFPPADPPPGLEQFIIDNAGDAGTSLDGFDQAFQDVVDILGSMDVFLGSLGGSLLSAFAEADTIDEAPVGDTIAGFADSLTLSANATTDLGTLLGGAGAPTPPARCPTAITATATKSADCGSVSGWPVNGSRSLPFTIQVQLVNQSSSTVHIAGWALYQPHPGVFEVSTDCGSSLAPGETCDLCITQKLDEGNGFVFQVKANLTQPALTEVLCFQVGLTSGGPGGGGGGGGGGGAIFNNIAVARGVGG